MSMDKEKIKNILSRGGQLAQESEACLDAEQLATFLEGNFQSEQHDQAERHLADCTYCLDRVAAIVRSEDDSDSSIPDQLLEKAGSLPSRQSTRRFPRWAVAAAAVLAVGLVFQQLVPRQDTGLQGEPRQVRYSDRNARQPLVLAPEEGSAIFPSEQVFRWTEVSGSLFYDVRLVSPDGDLIVRERVQDTRWLIPENLGLEAGMEYFVRVDAYLNDSKFLSSEHVVFSIRGEQ